MAEKNADTCKHPGCNCTVAKGSKYLQRLLRECSRPRLWAPQNSESRALSTLGE